MDHVVYLDTKAKELQNMLSGSKHMIIRGAAGRKLPYGRVNESDWLYLLNNDGSGMILARARAGKVINSEKMDKPTSIAMVTEYMPALQLTPAQVKRWAGKRYLVLIEIEQIEQLQPFAIDRSEYGNMDDWLPVEDIDTVRK